MRMAAVFTLATTTILLRTRLAPRWLVAVGYAIGLLLLVAVGFLSWVELLFPAWVLALSVYVLIASFSRARDEDLASFNAEQALKHPRRSGTFHLAAGVDHDRAERIAGRTISQRPRLSL